MRTRWIILAVFVARLKAMRLPKCVTGEGCGQRGGPEKGVDGVFPRRLQSFRYPRPPMYDSSPGQRGIAQAMDASARTLNFPVELTKSRFGNLTRLIHTTQL